MIFSDAEKLEIWRKVVNVARGVRKFRHFPRGEWQRYNVDVCFVKGMLAISDKFVSSAAPVLEDNFDIDTAKKIVARIQSEHHSSIILC